MNLYNRAKKSLYNRNPLAYLRLETFIYNVKRACSSPTSSGHERYLYASAVGSYGKVYLEKIIRRFGYDDFDYLIFRYDNTSFDEPIFNKCEFILEPGIKWYFAKKYLTPERVNNYRYIFFWDEDIDILDLSPKRLIGIMRHNNLQLAQPCLTPDSYYSHKIVLKDPSSAVGRYTDFVEVMAQIYENSTWQKFWPYIECGSNFWGWGYDYHIRDVCKLSNMGIVDSEPVRHTKPVTSQNYGARDEMFKYLEKYPSLKWSKRVSYGQLRYPRRLDKIAAL